MSLDQVSPMQKQSTVMIGNESLLVECAKLWVGSGHEIATIITRNSDIADWAKSQGHAVTLHDGALKDVTLPDGFDWLLSIANLQIIPADHLAQATKGAVNFHDGPLPAYAGLNAPVWARMNGETGHGISWHLIEGDVDEGDLLVQRNFAITEKDTALTLNTKCFAAAIESFPEVISALTAAQLPRLPQDLTNRSYFGLSDRPAAGGRLDFSKTTTELASLVRALDHGAYFNPLCAPKIAVGEDLFLLAEIGAAEGQGESGEVLAVDATSLTVACVDGAVTLSAFTDLYGQPVDPCDFVKTGEVLSQTADAAHIDEALKRVARHEPYWRTALANFHALDLPLVGAANASAKLAFQPLKVPAQTEMKHVVAAAALLAHRSGGEEGAGIAYCHSAQTVAPGDLAEWVPLSFAPVFEDTVTDYVKAAETALDEIEAKDTFARDLVARAPDIDGLKTPDLAVVSGAGIAPVSTAATNIMLSENGAQLSFDEARVSKEHADLLAARFELIIAGISKEEGRVGDIDALPDAEREKLLNGWIGASVDIDPKATIHTEFAKQAAATPDATALVFEHASLTYAELDARSNQCAQVLKARGVSTGDVVGVHCRRSLDLVVACLAAMKAGAAYLPLDPGFPADRIAIYLEDSAARFVISQSAIASDLPETGADILLIDAEKSIEAASQEAPVAEASGSDLAYLIFTSGSTGRPKGVMVEHTNVVNFFAGMDDRVKTDGPATWLAVTSLSFDISVLELFYTLTRGHKVVISGDESATQISDGPVGRDGQGMEFSLYYWGNDDGAGRGKYRLLLEGAKFADDNGFCAIWTPERHFHAFGGPYPNPSVTGAAVAGFTKNIGVRAGSCVAPLHHTARIAEEWAVIDNLTGGKAGLAIASGWQPDDFVLRPENTPPHNKVAMFEQIADLRKLWRGEAVAFPRADGTTFEALTQPRPVSSQPDIWVTTAGNPETWKEAGRNGAHILTHLLGQSIDEVSDKIKLYHTELRAAGHNPDDFKVTLMLHTFVGEDRETVRETAREPMKNYLRSAAGLIKQYAWAFPAFKKPEGVSNPFELDLGSLNDDEMEGILEFAFLRYFEDSGLFGTVDDCAERVESLQKIGVTEVACLIDYGIDTDVVLEGLRPLAQIVKAFEGGVAVSDNDVSIAGQIIRYDVTHLQCTPSMARLLTMNDEASTALSRVKHMFLGGEALPGALVGQLNTLSDATITNMYGPTETTIWSSTATTSSEETTANIGQPVANTTLYVVDEDLHPVPFGVPGELLIGGTGVTRGYWNREDLTADRFVPDHFAGKGRLYRTGDLVQRRLDGALDFIGRADHQVKLRGYRIELGEIENRLEALNSVNEVVVITREDVPGDVRLVAYTTGTATESEMRAELNLHVPSYMVPSHFVRLDALPLTPNKKIDRKALPAPAKREAPEPDALVPKVEASTEETADVLPQIADLWSRILGVDGIGASDNFFDLGGHSLLAVQAHREMRDSLGFKGVSITDIFRFPTLSGIAGRVAALAGSRVAKATPVAAPSEKPAAEAVETTPAATSRQDAMAKRRAMRARRREKQS
ncbi:MupA/Atu3671 family FMN-dependent luciferase-like monooxygenase [Cognatishimia activa]|uniref:Dimodular nonribosomal peptide synthase n=1 Tax=Cognatishimia activa TaxID=1715691 RepID=A0A0P1IMU0_9RHOB|nr:MupA/Atu3671 family FMN-dependent luciferase-like monooxygenase [Cognatishimia activa]CUJ13126.1 Dimodular nonribosomal peptide synthase [Cognatishimia activa]CUK24951.1 Dimodular nonribosomal peptide synthase [Cognatishimia activa]